MSDIYQKLWQSETRREIKQTLAKATKDIRHSDQSALGISTDQAMEAIRRGQEEKR